MATTLLARAMQTRMATNAATFNQPTIVVDSAGRPDARGVAAANVPANTYSTIAIAATAAAASGGGNGSGGVKKKRPETLFGPDLGAGEASEEGWGAGGNGGEGKAGGGEKVSLETVRNWVERAKSEEGVHPTTTLQALVNLKRPTLQLTPVSPPDIAAATTVVGPAGTTAQRHALSFTYDASTPRVRITLALHPSPGQTANGTGTAAAAAPPLTLYEGTHPGGFGRTFRLAQEHALDLAAAVERARAASMDEASTDDGKGELMHEGVTTELGAGAGGPNANGSTGPTPAGNGTAATPAGLNAGPTSPRRRFPFLGGLGARRREADVEAQILAEASGNTYRAEQRAAAADAGAAGGENGGEAIEMSEQGQGSESKVEEEGMRVLITIAGLQENDQPLQVPNAQLTHILIMGMTAATAGDAAAAGETATSEAAQRRVWVIKVVRREAIIGSHTFLLKEIYGLASSTNADEPVTTSANTYPPPADAADDPYASTPNECIVCLTSPRDVVLLPCRHLVVCRECAVGMIEFGAGGKVARREDAEVGAGADAAASGTPGEPSTAAAATANATPIPAPTRERRKKKAKGWFCPVCRQPYTSLLRLALPSSEDVNTAESHLHQLSRAPSAAGGASLRRVSSRATLPERGERMLEQITPSQPDDADDKDEVAESQPVPEAERPQFVLGEDVAPHDAPPARQSTEGRRSVEGGGGWKQVV